MDASTTPTRSIVRPAWVLFAGCTICLLASRASAGIAGDMNCDGHRNGLDLAPFLHALDDPKTYLFYQPDCDYFDGDLNADGNVDMSDVQMLVDLMMGPSDAPETTTGYLNFSIASGNVGIPLEGTYPAHPEHTLKYTITELPDKGYLYQYNPQFQQISTVPFELATNWVAFKPEVAGLGYPYDQIAYTVSSVDNSATSAPRRVALNRTPPDAPFLNAIYPQGQEDTPMIIELEILYEELAPPGNILTLRIDATVSPIFGTLYQIEPDGVTFGQIIASGDIVTNPDRLVGYAPVLNFSGNSANFLWSLEDSMGLYDQFMLTTINLEQVNDTPIAIDTLHQATHLLESFFVKPSFQDIDQVPCFPGAQHTATIHTLPENGLIYVNTMTPENLISQPGMSFPISHSVKLIYQVTQPGLGSPFDQLTWSLSDGCAASNVATMTINIVHGNSPPIMDPVPSLTVTEDSDFIYITLTASDIDEGPGLIHWFIKTLPTKGSLQILNILGTAWVPVVIPNTQVHPNGPEVVVRYKPFANENTLGGPPDQFTVEVADEQLQNPVHEPVFIHITAVNDPPAISGSTTATARILIPSGQNINAVIDNLAVTDDAGDALIEVGLSATNSDALFLNSTTGLVDFVQRTPTSMFFRGTVANVNAALAAGIQYDPLTFGGGFIDMTVYDVGNVGEEQPPMDFSASHQVFVVTNP